jgi:hypothetical protein
LPLENLQKPDFVLAAAGKLMSERRIVQTWKIISASAAVYAALTIVTAPVAAQQSESPASGDAKSWSSSGGQHDPSGNINPIRTQQIHSENGDHKIDKQSMERLGPDGRYIPYMDVESESNRVDANTVRTVQRTFARDPDGRRTLQQVTEIEQRSVDANREKTVRTTSNPDVNGRLQIANREIQDSRQVSPTVKETSTTVFTPAINGGLSAAMKFEQRDIQTGGQTQFRKSTLLPDGRGGWQVSEVREGTVSQQGNDRVSEETIARPDTDGRLAISDRTIQKQSAEANGESRETTKTYSTTLPGTSGNGALHLNAQATKTTRNRVSGGQTQEEKVQQRNPGATDSLRVTGQTIDIVRPAQAGTTQQRIIRSVDANGNANVVWVDTQKDSRTPSTQVQIAPPSKPK